MSLRERVLHGSAFLALREGAGTALSIGGMLLLTRLIGPANYGIYASAHVLLAYLVALSEAGLGVYLVRLGEEEGDRAFHQAFTLLLGLSAAGVLLALAALPLLEGAVQMRGMRGAATALIVGLPLVHLVKVPMARLERALDYKRVAAIELAGHLAYYVVGLTLAFRGAGVWAPVAGWWADQVVTCVLVYRTGYRPRLVWDRPLARTMLSYGLSYSVSLWVTQLRSFANPVVVGRFLGAAGVGYVALAIRILDSLGFVKVATTRISIAALARLLGERDRLARALTEGMSLQVLAVAPLIVGFGVVAPFVIPLVFGPEWLPTLQVFPLLGLSYIAGSMFMLHSSALVTLHRNYDVAVLFGAAWLLVPRYGAAGFGWAEVATIPTYLLLHALTARRVDRLGYAHALVWFAAFAVPLLAFRWILFTWPVALLPLLWEPTRTQVMGVVNIVLKRGGRGGGHLAPADVAPSETPPSADGVALAAALPEPRG
jgi:PST family polysaccharide transporter